MFTMGLPFVHSGFTLGLLGIGFACFFLLFLMSYFRSGFTLCVLWVYFGFTRSNDSSHYICYISCYNIPRVNLEETLEINLGISWGLLSVMFDLIGTVCTLFISTLSLMSENSFGKLHLTI